MKKTMITQIILGTVVILICATCQRESSQVPLVSATTRPDALPSAFQATATAFTKSASTGIIQTSTLRRTPTLTSTLTQTSIPTPTLTPGPTLNAEESRNAFLALMETNGNCEFPCLWGWEPDVSLLISINNFLFGFGEHHQEDSYISEVNIDQYSDLEGWVYVEEFKEGERRYYLDYNYDFRPDYGYLWINMQGFNLSNEELGYYSLPNILSIYGRPEQIFVSANTEEQFVRPTDWLEFSLVLFYPHKGAYIEYLLTRTKDETYFYGCPNDVHGLYVFTWDPYVTKSPIEIMEYPKAFYQMHAYYHFPLAEVNEITNEKFTTIFSDPSADQCLRVPKP